MTRRCNSASCSSRISRLCISAYKLHAVSAASTPRMRLPRHQSPLALSARHFVERRSALKLPGTYRGERVVPAHLPCRAIPNNEGWVGERVEGVSGAFTPLPAPGASHLARGPATSPFPKRKYACLWSPQRYVTPFFDEPRSAAARKREARKRAGGLGTEHLALCSLHSALDLRHNPAARSFGGTALSRARPLILLLYPAISRPGLPLPEGVRLVSS